MFIDSYVSGRRFGGYQYKNYSIKVESHGGKSVRVILRNEDGTSMLGSLDIDSTVARWLATTMLQAADDRFGLISNSNLKVRDNTALTKETVAFNNLLISDIEELSLSQSTIKRLKGAGITRVIDLISIKEDELMDIPKLAASAIKEIKNTLEGVNLSLGFEFTE